MFVGIFGDWHGTEGYEKTMRLARAKGWNAVIQCGDNYHYNYYPNQPPVYAVHGNHEDWPILNRHDGREFNNFKARFVAPWQVLDLYGVKIGFVGGIVGHGYNVKNHWTMGAQDYYEHVAEWMNADPPFRPTYPFWIDETKDFEEPFDILISHDKVKIDKDTPENPLCRALLKWKPKYALHGHLHQFFEYKVGETKCWSLDPTDRTMFSSYYAVLDTDTKEVKINYHEWE